MKRMRWGLGILLLMPVGYAAAQSAPAAGASSSADAATAAQDAKPKKARVWDNDNIPKSGDEISVVGQPEASADGSGSANGTNGASGNAAKSDDNPRVERKTDKDAKVEAAKEKLESLKKDMDLMVRKLALDSDTYYSKPDYSTDPAGADQIKSEKDGVAAKQDEVDAAQKELDALEAELNASDGGASNSGASSDGASNGTSNGTSSGTSSGSSAVAAGANGNSNGGAAPASNAPRNGEANPGNAGGGF